MGFFSGLGKILAGKPVFENPDGSQVQPSRPEQAPQPDQPSRYDSHGYKIIPHVHITRCTPKVHENDMEIWGYVKNDSDSEIEIEKIEILGSTTRIDHRVRPHHEDQILLYRGKLATTDHEHKAKLYYQQIEVNDYFCANHYIKYHLEHNGQFSVRELELEGPVQDV